jgi:hypothetical protein
MAGDLKPCPYCAEQIMSAATKCKHCGSVLKKKNVTFFEAVLVIGVSLFMLSLCLHGENTTTTAWTPPATVTPLAHPEAPASPITPAEVVAPSIPMPAIEQRFIQTVAAAQTESQGAANDMQRGGIKAKRDKAICAVLSPPFKASNWIGTMATIDSNSDGKGVVEIKIADDITVETTNNSLSDSEYGTLIEPGSPVFVAASGMSVGQPVMFSGNFFADDNSCIVEMSLTLHGKLKTPDFLFRFSGVSSPHSAPANRTSL